LIGLFDRDVFLKLACCDLWNEALVCLGVTHPYRLASTTSATSTRKVLQRRLPASAVDDACVRAAAIVAAVPVLPLEFILMGEAWPHRSRLLAEPAIGEDALLASIFFMMQRERVLVTGDKRFLIALRQNVPREFAAQADRIVSFEACVLAVTKRYGFAYVLTRVHRVAACDGSLVLAIGPAERPTEDEFIAALQSYDPVSG